MSSFKTQNKKLQPGTVIVGENGLPVDTIATLSSSHLIVSGVQTPLVYAGGTVTVPNSVDLNLVRYSKTRYTGRLILRTNEDTIYFIDRISVVDATKSFKIYTSIEHLSSPATIDLSKGWTIAEAEIVNRLATSAAAKIDQVEFRDMQFQFELDGDPVTITDGDGDELDVQPDGSILTNSVSDINVLNPVIVPQNVKVIITVPAAARNLIVKARGNTTTLKVYQSAASPLYFTVWPGSVFEMSNISRTSDLELHIESNKPNQILEIIYYTLQ